MSVTTFLHSVTAKLIVVAILTAMLFVPLAMVWALVGERAGRRDEVVRDVGSVWGARQTVGGVALSIPFDIVSGSGATETRVTSRMTVLPKTLDIQAVLTPEVRRRSIFEVMLYRTRITATGTFVPPDVTRLGVAPAMVHWPDAALLVGVSDLRGVGARVSTSWGSATIEMEPAADPTPFASGLRGAVPISASDPVAFRIEIELAGSGALMFLPSGEQTRVTLQSTWHSPSFTGALLPSAHTIDASGFKAEWQSNFLSRPFPQVWLNTAMAPQSLDGKLASATFGADLVTPVDHYQQTERAVKYGFLFIVLTFAVFLVWETVEKLRLHPVQYLFVGLALVVFYLLLLSVSEQVSFVTAYAVASIATVGLVSGYAARVLGGVRSGLGIAAAVGTLYALLFVLLSLEDLALLVGSVAVFLGLAVVMYLTRGINWYGEAEAR